MYYTDGNFTYSLEQCIHKHSEEYKKIFFNVLTIKVALFGNSKQRIKMKEVDLHGMILNVVQEVISVFDKFLTNTKGYKKYAVIDEYDGTDTTEEQDVDYAAILYPFKGFFDSIEVK